MVATPGRQRRFYAQWRLRGLWPGAGAERYGDRQRQFHAGWHFGQRPVYVKRRRPGPLGRFVHPNESATGSRATKHYAGGKQFHQHHPDRLGSAGENADLFVVDAAGTRNGKRRATQCDLQTGDKLLRQRRLHVQSEQWPHGLVAGDSFAGDHTGLLSANRFSTVAHEF